MKTNELEDRSYHELEKDLEQVMEVLEKPDTPLEKSLEEYERGVLLLREAQRRLDTAEQRIVLLEAGEGDDESADSDD